MLIDRYDIKCRADDFMHTCGRWFLLAIVVFVLGVVLGIVSGVKLTDVIEKDKLKDYVIDWFVDSKRSVGGFFFRHLMEQVLLVAIVMLFSMTFVVLPCGVVVFCLKGYLLSYNLILLMNILQAGGIFFLIVVYLPMQLLQVFCLIFQSCWMWDRCVRYRKVGIFAFRGVDYPRMLGKVFFWFCIFLGGNLLLTILFGLFSSNFIF